jgi:hypothetical protein
MSVVTYSIFCSKEIPWNKEESLQEWRERSEGFYPHIRITIALLAGIYSFREASESGSQGTRFLCGLSLVLIIKYVCIKHTHQPWKLLTSHKS